MDRSQAVLLTIFSSAVLAAAVGGHRADSNPRAPATATGEFSKTPPPAPKKKKTREVYREELLRLIDDAGLSCSTDSDCDALPVGSKPCGGPTEYVTVSRSASSLYGDRFQDLQAAIAEMDQARNRESGLVGTCTVLEKPKVRCSTGRCQ